MIEITQAEIRTGDAMRVKAQIIGTIQGWKHTLGQNDWLLDEWDDEFKNWLNPILDSVAPLQQSQIVQSGQPTTGVIQP